MNFNPKKYQNQRRVYQAVLGAPKISKVWLWTGQEYTLSPRPFRARKNEMTPEGKIIRRELFFGSLSAARQWQSGKILPKEINKPGEGYTVAHLIKDYVKDKWPLLREGTRIYRSKALKLMEPLYGTVIEELRPAHIDEWLRGLKSDPTRFTKRRKDFLHELESLGGLLRYYIDHNDETKLVLPIKKRHKEMAKLREGVTLQKRFMLPDELEKWFSELQRINPQAYAMGFIQTHQMLRVSEVAAMKWSNLNLENRSYRLCEHVIWPRLDGRLPELVSGTKTMKAGQYADLPLTDSVVTLLKTLPRNSELIFHNQGKLLTYRQIQHSYDSAFKRAKLPFRGTHICRHTGATRFLEETGDFLALQQMGNWSDLETALHYGKIMKDRARKALDRVTERNLRIVGSGSPDDDDLQGVRA